jgi:hypothetical protein
MREITSKEKKVALVNSNGLMEASMSEISMIIIFTEKESIHGAIKEFSKEIGKTIKWMAKENLLGLMAESMLEVIKMIRKKDMVFLNGKFLYGFIYFNFCGKYIYFYSYK